MSGIVVFPATTRQNQIAWSGIPDSPDTTLFMNSDLNNFVYLGYTPNLIPNVNSIPVAPNGNVVLPANRTIYAIWSVSTGVAPLVIIPGGAAYFLGLTQGLGNLAIPSIQSPNYVPGISGWTIKKDGSAEFNNLTIRGTFVGFDFIINQNGAFFYNGPPALGNLKISIVSNGGGVDQFGNVYVDNITAYNVAVAGGGYAQIAANPVTGMPFLVLLPPGATHLNAPPQAKAGITNAGAVNEQAQFNATSGNETAQPTGAATLQLVARANDGTLPSIANLIADLAEVTLPDANNYQIGALTQLLAANFPVVNTSATQVTGMLFNVTARTYRLTGFLRTLSAAAGVLQPMTFSFHGSATVSNMSLATNAYVEQGNTTTNPGNISALAAAPSVITGNVPLNTVVDHTFDGYVSFNAAGNIGLFVNLVTSAADETFTVQAANRTWWRLEPA